MFKISIIVATYNRPDALYLVLKALAAQQVNNFNYEVIIADDGSDAKTQDLIQQLQPQLTYPLQHIWQKDEGFRLAKIRNLAIAASTGDYLIFLDGDCVPQVDFIAKHYQLAEKGWFVAGNRILLSSIFTQKVIENQQAIWSWNIYKWLAIYLQRKINRLSPLLRLPNNFLRKLHKLKWQGANGCNIAVWRKNILAINGFDEQFQGWGHEDADLVVRLFKQGVYRKEGRFAVPVFHLWHPQQDRSQEAENFARLGQQL
ncbi:MAG: glycosyltransferase family 2 protein [Thiomargarita sp.]|nr:glycosyltransferase family 2 protein [Thiomargarita sp.]